MKASCCPDPDELRAFSSGLLTGPAFDLVAEHVERCPLCDRALEAFDEPTDGLLTHLRRAPRDPQPEEGLPHGLLQAVRSLPTRRIRTRVSAEEPWRLGRFDLLEELGAGSFGPCVPRDRRGAGPYRGDQGPPGRRAHVPGRCRTVPPRGPQRGPAHAPGHRDPPRGRARRRRHVLSGRGVRPRHDAGATIARRSDPAPSRGRAARRGRRGAGIRPSPRRDPPRHQALEHPDRRRRAPAPDGLRPGQARDRRDAVDRGRPGPGHAGLHEPRAGARRLSRGRRPERRLQPRGGPLRAAHRRAPVPGEPADAAPAGAGGRAAPAATAERQGPRATWRRSA